MSGAIAGVSAAGRAAGVLAASLSSGGNTSSSSETVKIAGIHGVGDFAGGELTENWVSPANASVAANYEVLCHVNSGAFTGGPAQDTWLSCSTQRQWIRTGAGTVNYTLSFRQKNGPTLKTYTLSMVVS